MPINIVCPECSHPNLSGTQFCTNCGNSLTMRCKNCWAQNGLSDRYCGGCGNELSKTRYFCVPDEVAEQWTKLFKGFEWAYDIPHEARLVMSRGDSPYNELEEGLIAGSTIKGSGWSEKVIADSRTIYKQPTKPLFGKKDPGIAGWFQFTRCRLIVVDYAGWTKHYPYEYLKQVTMNRVHKPRAPIFDLDFGSHGFVSICRSQMTDIPGPIGIIEWFALGKNAWSAASARNQLTMLAAQNLQNEGNENKLLVSFLEFLIQSRVKLFES